MNMKKKKNKKISSTVVLFSAAVLLVFNVICAIVMSTIISYGINQKQDAYMKQVTLNAKAQVEQFIEKYIGVTEMLAIDDRMTGLMAEMCIRDRFTVTAVNLLYPQAPR